MDSKASLHTFAFVNSFSSFTFSTFEFAKKPKDSLDLILLVQNDFVMALC